MTAYNLARKEIGTWEWADGHNPKIVKWFADAGHSWVTDDETAWCAAFVGAMLKAANQPNTGKLNARSYLDLGEVIDLPQAREGDIVIFSRGDPNGWQGHVGFYVGRVGDQIVVLGGNQGNQVNERKYPVSRLLGIRRIPENMPAPRDSVWETKTAKAAATKVTSAVGGGALVAVSDMDWRVQMTLIIVFGALAAGAAWIWFNRRRDFNERGWR